MAKGKSKVKVRPKNGSHAQQGPKKVTLKPKVKIILSSSKERQ